MRAHTILVGGFLAAAALLALSPEAQARPTIKNPNDHPDYRAELEPHGTFIFWHGRYLGDHADYRPFGDPEFGAGFRATIELGDPAFVPKINNTVGITFGIDVTNYNCRRCRYYNDDDFLLWTPIGLQWNFFFTDKFSAFADLGFMLRGGGFYNHVNADFFGMVGGRYHFTDKVALTFRLGVPFVTVGASFFVGS